MNLIYKATGKPVALGDIITLDDGEAYQVHYFRKPTSPASSGKITIMDDAGVCHEFYVGVIGAEWINREDRYHV